MMISSKGRYALRVMVDLAGCGRESYTPLRDIAARQGLSLKYLESIMSGLSKGGLVEGVHGKGGGYRLSLDPAECRVGDILRLTEGSLSPVDCRGCGLSGSRRPCRGRHPQTRPCSMWS